MNIRLQRRTARSRDGALARGVLDLSFFIVHVDFYKYQQLLTSPGVAPLFEDITYIFPSLALSPLGRACAAKGQRRTKGVLLTPPGVGRN
jgi:hypothetical protein